jgi:hypothetical protein
MSSPAACRRVAPAFRFHRDVWSGYRVPPAAAAHFRLEGTDLEVGRRSPGAFTSQEGNNFIGFWLHSEKRHSSLTGPGSALTSASLCGKLRLFKGNRRENRVVRGLTEASIGLTLTLPVSGHSVDRSLKTESESIVTYSGPESCGHARRGSIQKAVTQTTRGPQSESNTYTNVRLCRIRISTVQLESLILAQSER